MSAEGPDSGATSHPSSGNGEAVSIQASTSTDPETPPDPSGGGLPTVSIVMPIRNESRYIGATLQSVLDQDYPADRMEVIIADGMSDDGTREIVAGFAERHPNVKLIDNPKGIVSPGLNRAIREAGGEYIVRVDGHAGLPAYYVRRIVETFLSEGDKGVQCVTGSFESVGASYAARAIAGAVSSRFALGGSTYRVGTDEPRFVDAAAYGAWPKSLFARIGLFNEHMVRHQDYELSYRLIKAGGRILLLPDLSNVYYVRSSIGRLWRQYFEYGVWKGRFLRSHPDAARVRHLPPPAFVGVCAALGLAAPFFSAARLALAAILGAYALANLACSLLAAARCGLSCLPLLPVAYATIHWGWGAGVLCGLLIGPVPAAPAWSSPREGGSVDDQRAQH